MTAIKLEQRHFDVLRAAAALCAGRRELPLLEGWQKYIEEVPDLLRTMQAAPVKLLVPDNLDSHCDAWTSALQRLIQLEPDGDDRAYYEHELKAMCDMYVDLDRLRESAAAAGSKS